MISSSHIYTMVSYRYYTTRLSVRIHCLQYELRKLPRMHYNHYTLLQYGPTVYIDSGWFVGSRWVVWGCFGPHASGWSCCSTCCRLAVQCGLAGVDRFCCDTFTAFGCIWCKGDLLSGDFMLAN